LADFTGKTDRKPFQPHRENERQQSVNYFWSGVMGNLGGDRFHIVINSLLAAFMGKSESESLPARCSN
jgi:hypothetical protein